MRTLKENWLNFQMLIRERNYPERVMLDFERAFYIGAMSLRHVYSSDTGEEGELDQVIQSVNDELQEFMKVTGEKCDCERCTRIKTSRINSNRVIR